MYRFHRLVVMFGIMILTEYLAVEAGDDFDVLIGIKHFLVRHRVVSHARKSFSLHRRGAFVARAESEITDMRIRGFSGMESLS